MSPSCQYSFAAVENAPNWSQMQSQFWPRSCRSACPAGVSNDKRQGYGTHFDDNTIDKSGVTTPPRMIGNGSRNSEVQIETASDSNSEHPQLQQMRTDSKGTREQDVLRQITEELLIEQATERHNQKELQTRLLEPRLKQRLND